MQYLKLILSIGLLVLVASCAGRQAALKEMDFASLVPEMEKKSGMVRQFQADFQKTRYTQTFQDKKTVNGTLLFQQPGNFQLTLTGDVNIEILSNGKIVTLIHDGRDQEFFFVHGERDSAKMADPLMAILQTMSNGGLRKFSLVNQKPIRGGLELTLKPSQDSQFERINKVELEVSEGGEIQKVGIDFLNGDRDETVFKKWSLLASDDPQILQLSKRLNTLAASAQQNDYRALGQDSFSMIQGESTVD